ncbi:hypothetical protein H4R33_000443 [Dimargaris cristalligena]|nr:hypothetical protein H4R33_000443 [Dimargaris cristalligena]
MRVTISLALCLPLLGAVFPLSTRGADVDVGRFDHSSIYFNKALFILGGQVDHNGTLASSHLSLDLATPFNTDQPPWLATESSTEAPPPAVGMAVGWVDGISQRQVLARGGRTVNEDNSNTTDRVTVSGHDSFIYGSQNQQWAQITMASPAKSSSESEAALYGASLVTPPHGRWLIQFGGLGTSGSSVATTMKLSITKMEQNVYPPQEDTPSPRHHHTAVIHQSIYMAVVGGQAEQAAGKETDSPLADTVYLFNTLKETWSQSPATGSQWFRTLTQSPGVMYHSRIIFYGGLIQNERTINHQFLILDYASGHYTWHNRTVANMPSTGRYGHSATLVGRYLIIAFGTDGTGPLDDTIVVDLETWERMQVFDQERALDVPAEDRTLLDEANNKGAIHMSAGKIAGIVIGGLAGLGCVGFLVWWGVFYRSSQAQKQAESEMGKSRHNSLFLFLDKLPIGGGDGPPSGGSRIHSMMSPGFRSRFPKSPRTPRESHMKHVSLAFPMPPMPEKKPIA